MNRTALFASLVVASLYTPGAARAETINCTNIASVPTVITTQGVYCLKQDLSTSLASGTAITIATNNVTIDCNGYKLGGLAAGPNTQAAGIRADNRLNATIRNCNIRGFKRGVYLIGNGGGHIVEDNRLDGSTDNGIAVVGSGSVIRRNMVFDTGGDPNALFIGAAIFAAQSIDIVDNTVAGVRGTAGTNQPVAGILLEASNGSIVHGNRIRDVVGSGTGQGYGFLGHNNSWVSIRGNHLANEGTGIGIECNNGRSVITANSALGFQHNYVSCSMGNDNHFN